MLPSKAWATYQVDLKLLGERRGLVDLSDGFLESIGFVTTTGELTSAGEGYFRSVNIARDDTESKKLVHDGLLLNDAALAICQDLYGVSVATKINASSVLRSRGVAGYTDRKLGTLLAIMDAFELIQYVKGQIHVFEPPLQSTNGAVPRSVFISRATPFSNELWLIRVLRECKDHIYWLDKHFQIAGLEAIADAADANRVSVIRVLSLQLPDNSSSKSRRKYLALKQELATRGIDFEWRFIDSKQVRDTHDRWIVGGDSARNVPDVGTIMSGNHSEMTLSDSTSKLNQLFGDYWDLGTPAA